MKVLLITAAVVIPLLAATFATAADTSGQIDALQAQIKALQAQSQEQIQALQMQIDALKEQAIQQEKDKEELIARVESQPEAYKTWWDQATQSGNFRLRDAVGLDEGSGLNIAGELNWRYRENLHKVGSDQNFQLYEIELFMDATVNDYTSIFVEYPISHKNYLNPGNTWIDLHFPGTLAGTEETGIMMGNFSPRFGYLNYDDNQSWVYGGRTTTNTTLVRGKSIDSQTIRNRQLGISAPIKLGALLIEPGIYDGSGPVEFSGGGDNDRRVDFTSRIQYTLPEELGVIGAGYWHAPKTKDATSNTAGTRHSGSGAKHVRDIDRFAVYFKYPDVQQATLPDLSLGGKPFMVYGECIWGTHKANNDSKITTANMNRDQDFLGWYLETNVNIIRDKLVGILRYDYFDPDRDVTKNTLMALTPAIKWNVWQNTWLTVNYENYFGNRNASGLEDDRISVEMAVWF